MSAAKGFKNNSLVAYFILQGLSENSLCQNIFSITVLWMLCLILLGNLTTFSLVCSDEKLHTPMYFFLVNLSLLDMSYSTTTLCTVIKAFVFGDQSISFTACITQMYFYIFFINCEVFVLAAMSYDRYVAICDPLKYHVIMTFKTCSLMSATTCMLAFTDSFFLAIAFSSFSCFISNTINHYFCDLRAYTQLSCNNVIFIDYMMLIEAAIFCLPSVILTILSYWYIIRTILKIQLSSSRKKAFFTCSSQLIIVVLFYTIIFGLYLRPVSMPTTSSDKLLTLLYTAGTSLVNPLIYTLKNEDVKTAFKRKIKRILKQDFSLNHH